MMTVNQLADLLLERARDEHDIEAARLLRQFKRTHDVAREVVRAKTHEASKAAYAELVDLMKGKAE
jgi:hypothetical protein